MKIGLEIVGLFVNTTFDVPDSANVKVLADFLRYLNDRDNSIDQKFNLFFFREKQSPKNYGLGVDRILVNWPEPTTTKSHHPRDKGVYELGDVEEQTGVFTVWQYYVLDKNGDSKSSPGAFVPAFSDRSPSLVDGDRVIFRCVVIAERPGKYKLAFSSDADGATLFE